MSTQSDITAGNLEQLMDLSYNRQHVNQLLGALPEDVAKYLRYNIERDEQTGAYLKKVFEYDFESAVKEAINTNKCLSLLIFDLDHFRDINSQFGHTGGDIVIKHSIKGLRGHTLGSDRIEENLYRVGGGEEFAIILYNTDLESAIKTGKRFGRGFNGNATFWRAETGDLYHIENGMVKLPGQNITVPANEIIQITSSIGVAELDINDIPALLYKRADDALYLAKKAGRNRVGVKRSTAQLVAGALQPEVYST